ncbi:MAG: hypothetical protein K9M02_15330 [Thiohalocapsa sp.]|jgi:hypothetical protein|nr:hypothetical protein [Thiohalocapsa sp.]
MEFFSTVSRPLSAEQLQQTLTGPRLADFCASIDRVLHWQDEQGEIYCLWGQFRVNRELIRDGVRFTLPYCPNALAWTVTADRDSDGTGTVLLHCCINRSEHEPDFIESIESFLDDWRAGLERLA